MTMYYDDRGLRILQQKMYEREVRQRQNIIEEHQRVRNSKALRQKPIPVKKSSICRA